ncbi:DUF6155 family protein [Desulfobacula sp.]|uniref:DUF6155 family protein n=1 Tax=Desulfobacula sp. TaxID=2593537 RepID=UPI0025BA0187|nr:DUF6155 family protein [Desulfobacula sp.]MBC2705126.1 hypothetical protein [Desulfobacula sp.]
MNIRELEKHLAELTKKELISEISFLFKMNSFSKDYLSLKFSQGLKRSILEKYKQQVKNEFYPQRGEPKLRLSIAKKAVSEFKKVSKSQNDIADIMMFYVENGVEFTCDYGDIDERFYNSMESMFESILKFVQKHNLGKNFQTRCKKIVDDTDGIGWGFHDQLGYLYHFYFPRS